MIFKPGHKDADAKGMVAMPNINIHEEMADPHHGLAHVRGEPRGGPQCPHDGTANPFNRETLRV